MFYSEKQLNYKINGAIKTINTALEQVANPYIACSWGKDSIVMLWLIRKIDKNIPVVYMNSNYSFPDNYEFRDRMLKEWNIKHYIELPPVSDYKEIVETFGLPGISRKSQDQEKVVSKLKKQLRPEIKEFDSVFLGIRASESRARQNMIRYSGKINTLKNGITKIMPIADWTFKEMWQIVKENNIPMNTIYSKDKFSSPEWIRNSGILSTDGASSGKIQWIKYYYPAIYRKLSVDYPEVKGYV